MQCIYKPPNETMAKILIVSDTLLLPHQWRKTRLKDRLRFTITYGHANYLLEKKNYGFGLAFYYKRSYNILKK